jgi:eukaryotic-like serine/threonine-protein kinase
MLSAVRSGTRLGNRFEIDREVGRGGVGIVYRAIDTTTGQPVALKLIASQGADAAEEVRFEREGRLLKDLDHPNIVKIVAWGTLDEGHPYIAMEWLDGEDLSSRTRRNPLALRDALDVAKQVATALAAAHAAGVVHRDIKPSNVFLVRRPGTGIPPSGVVAAAEGDPSTPGPAPVSEPPFAKLVDFGVALEEDIRLTRTGVVIGTPAYMAPEQARGESAVDARADIYSLGATLFELVAGRPPHVGPTAIATLARLVTTQAPLLSEIVPQVPRALDDLVAAMLAIEASGRPPNAAHVAAEIERIMATVSGSEVIHRQSVSTTATMQGTRLFTSIVAIGLGSGDHRSSALDELRAQGADAVALGQDALVAHFGARRSLGGEAGRALELGRWLADQGARVGVATGRSRVDLTRPVGEVVDRAAALAHGATGGQVLADVTTTELARGRFEFQVRGNGSAVVGPSLAPKRGDVSGGAPFLGREAELAQILSSYERCTDDSTPMLVSVTGPTGIGKSRLQREVLARLTTHSEAPRIALFRCEAFARQHPLGLAADVVRSLVGVTKGATLDTAQAALLASGTDAGEVLARFVADEVLPEGQGHRGARDELWLGMTDLVLRVVGKDAFVLVIEDMQWADPESVGWIDHLLARATGHPIFSLCLARPELWREPSAQGRFAGRDHVRIELRPISRRAAKGIARAMLGDSASDDLLDRIAAQAAGSPLFAEELARLFALGRRAEIAPTIEAAIQVSLDALDESCRDALARLSVFGLSGWAEGLTALDVTLSTDALRQLAAAELLVEQAESRFHATREWAFKNALVRDVVYASLGEAHKKQLHAQAGRWLAKMGEDAATIAEHLLRGGCEDESAEYWERAARRALAANALGDAVRMAELALSYADNDQTAFARAQLLDEAQSRLDPRAAERETAIRAMHDAVFDEASDLRARGASARYDDARGTGSDVAGRLARVAAAAEKLALFDEQARCTAVLAARHAFGGDLKAAERDAAQLLDLAETRAVAAAAVDGWQTLAVVRQTRGALASALDARRSAARAASNAGLKEREAMLRINVGFALSTIGARREAREAIEAGLEIAHAIGSAGAIRHGRMNLLGWAATFGAEPALDHELKEPRASADAAVGPGWVMPDRATLGVLFYRACELLSLDDPGAVDRARSLLEKSTEAYRSTGNLDILPVALGFWAEAERRLGHADKALALSVEAADLIEKGAPSLLTETPIFVALSRACMDLGNPEGAKQAIARGIVPLRRRIDGLCNTPYVRPFLSDLGHNSALLAAAEEHGLLPPELEELLEPPIRP